MLLLQNVTESNYHYQPSWVMVLIALSVMILGYLFSAFNSRFNAFLKAVFSIRFGNQLSREEYSLSHPTAIFLSANFFVTTSLFILQVITAKKIFPAFIDFDFPSFLIIIGFVFLVYLIKILSIQILGFIFDRQIILNEYTLIVFLVNQFIGIGFIPIIIFIAYAKQSFTNSFIDIGLALLIFAFILRVGKGTIAVLSEGKVAAFYLFLYLCTLEILPLLLGWKLFERLV